MTPNAIKSSAGFRGDRIKAARLDAGWTIAALAAALGVDPRTVAGWQANRSTPSYERLVQLARLLKQPPSFFLEDAA
jgi:transcriptional regulator with XRE-family HTH domain